MATVQSGRGRIELFEDFLGPEWIIAESVQSGAIGPFRVIGDGANEADSGILVDETTIPLNGVGIFTTSATTKFDVGVGTGRIFNVAKMGTIKMECRVQFADEDKKLFFFGLTDENEDDVSIEDDIISGSSTALTIPGDYLTGFFYDEGLNDDADWHAVYKGGTAAEKTTSTDVDLDNDFTSGEFQILRLEVDNNGTARWYIDGVLKQTVIGAASTTTDMAMVCLVAPIDSNVQKAYVDYVYVSANRDWTV